MENLLFIGVSAAVILIGLMVIGLIFSRIFKRATKERAFVRTGWGGQKVVKDGGALIVPWLHEALEVNMNTLKLDIRREGSDALLTADKMRMDVSAVFYTRVRPNEESIAAAAQTLGRLTLNTSALKELIEDKFVDALRSVAAAMTMADLNAKRTEFSAKVKEAIENDLVENGLELESISITRLDQTNIKYMDETNVFDAEGLANITKFTQEKRKERTLVEANTRVEIETTNMEAERKSLNIMREVEFAKLEQEREVETRRAEQEAELAKQRAERKREADIAMIEATQATDVARTEAERKQKEAAIEAAKKLDLAKQSSQIELNKKSEAESQARAQADAARAEAIKAAQEVITAEQIAEAERRKRIEILAAETEAERMAAEITIKAKAEFDAAELQAKARRIAADALAKENEVRAAGELAMAEAANTLSKDQIAMRIRLAAIEAAPKILAEVAKPMTAVKGARVVSINGLSSGGATVAGGTGSGSDNLPNQLSDAMLNYRLKGPLVDIFTKEIGIDLSKGLNGIIDANMLDDQNVVEATEVVDDSDDEVDSEELEAIKALAGVQASDEDTQSKRRRR